MWKPTFLIRLRFQKYCCKSGIVISAWRDAWNYDYRVLLSLIIENSHTENLRSSEIFCKYYYSTQNIRLIVVFRIYFFILFIKTTHYIGCRDVVHRLRVSVKFYLFNTMSEIKGNVKCLLMYFHLKNTIKEYLFRKNIHFLMIIRKEAEIRDFSTFFEVFSNKTF